MSDQEFYDKLCAKLDRLEDKTERTWRAIVGDADTHSQGIGQRVDQAEKEIALLKRDRTKAGALIGASLMILGAFGSKIIEWIRN